MYLNYTDLLSIANYKLKFSHRFYKGAVPTYIIADPDLLKQIMVKEFSKFTDRTPVSC